MGSSRAGTTEISVSRDDDVTLATVVDAKTIGVNLVDIIQSLLSPLYERLDFASLPLDIVQRELKRLRESANPTSWSTVIEVCSTSA